MEVQTQFSRSLIEAIEAGFSKEEFLLIWKKELDLKLLSQKISLQEAQQLPPKEKEAFETLGLEIQNIKKELLNLRNDVAAFHEDIALKIKNRTVEEVKQNLEFVVSSDFLELRSLVDEKFNDLDKKLDTIKSDLKCDLLLKKQDSTILSESLFLESTSSLEERVAGTFCQSPTSCPVDLYQIERHENFADQDQQRKDTQPNAKKLQKCNFHFPKSYQNKIFFNQFSGGSKKNIDVVPVAKNLETTQDITSYDMTNTADITKADEDNTSGSQSRSEIKNSLDTNITEMNSHETKTDKMDILNNKPENLISDSINCDNKDFSGNKEHSDCKEISSKTQMFFIGHHGNDSAQFTIPKTHVFYNREEYFYTDYYAVKKFPFKVKMRLNLSKDGKLQISAFISVLPNSKIDYPVLLLGNGYISAKQAGGGGYSKIWYVKWKLFKEPEDDFCIDTLVCLLTKRNTYNNITYDKLVQLGYFDQNHLQFLWDFAAKKLLY